jgi:putative ABC transport system permease protein
MLWESVKLALRTIRRNVLRSILTLLGIVIGVAAVIALVTIGQGATDKVRADLSRLGSNMLIARPGNSMPGPAGGNEPRTFSEIDVDGLRTLQNVRGIAPSANKQVDAIFEAASLSTTVVGTEPAYFTVQDWTFTQGGPFTDSDLRSGNSVCVIGETIRRELLRGANPIGAVIRISGVPCEVTGVLGPKGQSAFGTDQDSTIIMPLRAFHRRVAGNIRIAQVSISAANAESLSRVQSDAVEILRETRRVRTDEDDDFVVRDMTQIALAMSSTTSVMTGLLSAVATVSLLVGGIGIMNIMLVSVAERTREIGIRLAIGALSSQVLTQFLVEAIVLCLIGGLIGIALGLAIAFGASGLLEVPFAVNWGIVTLSFCFSGIIGLIFGFFPARRAAKLDPIEALRHE